MYSGTLSCSNELRPCSIFIFSGVGRSAAECGLDLSRFEHDLVAADIRAKGDVDVRGNAKVNGDIKVDGKIHFGPRGNDPYSLQKVTDGRDRSHLRLSLNDNPDESLRIYTNIWNRGGGDQMQHKFQVNGDAYHRGDIRAGGGLRVDGNTNLRGNANVNGRLHFKDDGNNTALKLTMKDDRSDRFEIWGDNCRHGGCSGPGRKAHQFVADGSAWHRGNLNVHGNANVNGRLHFKDDAMNTDHGSNGSSDSYWMERVKYGGNNTALKLTMKDDRSDRFEIWGDNCRHGGCSGPGRKAHQFVADGSAWHRGTVRAGGNLEANGNLDVRNPGGRGNHDGGRLRTYYDRYSTHLSLEEYDDNVSYEMKTHKNGDVAQLTKTRNGDVYLQNGGGHKLHLRPDGEVRANEFKSRRFTFSDRNNHGGDKTSLEYNGNGGVNMHTDMLFDIIESDRNRRAFRFDANSNKFCIGDTCIGEADLKKLKRM